MGEVREIVKNGGKKFVKPRLIKEFSGTVADAYSISSLNSLDDSHKVMVYDVLPKIHSEWRVYVLRHEMVYSSNYSGDFKLSPDYGYVQEVLKENKRIGFPVAYTVDIGICEDDAIHIINNNERHVFYKSVVIEYNDMWAIGNYGLDNWRYHDMLRERYFEIMRSSIKTVIVND